MPRSRSRLLGWLLLLPAGVLLIVQGIVPTITTVAESFRDSSLIGTDSRSVGGANYDALSADVMAAAGKAILIGVIPLFAAVLLGIALGIASASDIRVPRLVSRGLLAVPMACFAPVGMCVSALSHGTLRDVLAERDTAQMGLAVMMLSVVVGLVSAVVGTGVLAAFHRGMQTGDRVGARVGAAAVVGGVGILAAVALGLQTLVVPFLMSRGGPGSAPDTPALAMFQTAFMKGQSGAGSAVGVMIMIPVMVLGVLATTLVVASGTRVEILPGGRSARAATANDGSAANGAATRSGGQIVWAVIGVSATAVFVVVFLVTHGTWLGDLAGGAPSGGSEESSQALTWLPPLAGAILQVAIAGLGGYAIGWLRPLGKKSTWLLLAFSPGLFLTTTPFAVDFLDRSRTMVDSWFILVPSLLSVPALIVFTLVFAGARNAARRSAFAVKGRELVIPLVAGSGLVLALSWLIQAQSLLPQYLWKERPMPSLIADVAGLGAFRGGEGVVPQSYPFWLLVFFVIVLAAACAGLDRLVLRAGKARADL